MRRFEKLKFFINSRTNEIIDTLNNNKFSIWEKTKHGYVEKTINKISLMDQIENIKVAIVADVSGSMGDAMYTVQDAIYNLTPCMQFNIGDKAALYSFADTVEREQYFTTDKNALKNAIYGLQHGNMTALYDALAFSLSEIIVQNGAKCIIAFTDGIENASHCSMEYVIQKATQSNFR